MNAALILSGAMLGLASGGHCIAMCGAGSSFLLGVGEPASQRERLLRLATFQTGRILGYALVGLVLGGAAAAFQVLTQWIALLRPLWTMANTAMFLLGMTLLLTARQPQILSSVGERLGQWLGQYARGKDEQREKPVVMYRGAQQSPLAGVPVGASNQSEAGVRHRRALLVGLSWAFIPCGPLYSAWTLALFAGDPLSGALTGAAFASVSGAQLIFAQWWFARGARQTRGQGSRWDKAGIRIAGAALSLSAAYSIYMIATGQEGIGILCL